MKFKNIAVLHGIKESKGEYEGRAFDSTQYNLTVDLQDNTSGRSMGVVTRPFKCGPASDFDKWAHLAKAWPLGGLPCECEFDVVAGSDNSAKLILLSIKPAPQAPGKAG